MAKKGVKDESYLNQRLKLMSERDQLICKERIIQAIKLGWTHIDIWDEGENPSPWDLVGLTPKGELDFLPPVDEESKKRGMAENE